MPFTIVDIGLGIVFPAVITLVVFVALSQSSRWLRRDAGAAGRLSDSAAPIALGSGFEIGYWSLSIGPLVPDAHWHWLPFVVAAAVVMGVVSQFAVRERLRRCLLFLVTSIMAALLLTPTWDDLEPSRAVYLTVWPALATVIAVGLDTLFDVAPDLRSSVSPSVLVMTCAAASALLLLSGSLRFSYIAMTLMGPAVGLLASALLIRDPCPFRLSAYPVAVALCAMMLIGRVNTFSDIPLLSWLLIPFAPWGQWIVTLPAVRTLTKYKKEAAALALPLLMCIVALGTALWTMRETLD